MKICEKWSKQCRSHCTLQLAQPRVDHSRRHALLGPDPNVLAADGDQPLIANDDAADGLVVAFERRVLVERVAKIPAWRWWWLVVGGG